VSHRMLRTVTLTCLILYRLISKTNGKLARNLMILKDNVKMDGSFVSLFRVRGLRYYMALGYLY